MAKTQNVDPEVAKVIRQWREETVKLSRVELARHLEVAKTSVSNWELGQNEPNKDIYKKLATMATGSVRSWFLTKANLSDQMLALLIASGKSRPMLTKKKESSATDPELLERVLEAVEAAMNRAGGFFPIKMRAHLISEVYDRSRETGEINYSDVALLVNRASSPSNQKVRV
jgi:transcriptional regulator with XRE-family HTH domain